MAIVLTDGNKSVKDYMRTIEDLGGNITDEVKEIVAIKLAKETDNEQVQ